VRKLHFSRALVEDAWLSDVLVEVEGTRIVSVTPHAARDADATVVPGLAVPGVANLHSHAFQRAMAGLTERRGSGEDSFWSWREVMYSCLAVLTPEDVQAIAAYAYAEMLEAGFTSVGEFHYLHHDASGSPHSDIAEMGGRIATAAAKTGLGLTLLPCFYAHGGCGGRAPAEGQRRFISSLDGFELLLTGAGRHVASSGLADARLGLALHSLRAVAPGELAKLADAARRRERPIHIHAAEQQKEVEECLAWSGRRPVEWLLENATIDARWCLVHATHMTDAETAGLARSEAVAGLCPITESNLGDGIFPATRFMAAGGRLGVGSDSNVRISLASELRTLEYSQRLRDMRRNCLVPEGRSSGRMLLDAAARGGAQAIGRQAGALRAGLLADIVVLDTGHPALAGRSDDTALDTWLFAGGNELVGEVWSGGRHVVTAGRHIARDRLAPPFITVMRKLAATL